MANSSLPSAKEGRYVLKIPRGFWDGNVEKYQCCFGTVHVTSATMFIGYALALWTIFLNLFVAYCYIMGKKLPVEQWFDESNERFLSTFMLMSLCHYSLAITLVYSVLSETTSFLLASIFYSSVAFVFGFAKLVTDLRCFLYGNSFRAVTVWQPVVFAILILIDAWCVSAVGRCYLYLRDKKLADKITQKLSTARVAVNYRDKIPNESASVPTLAPCAGTSSSEEKQPLTIA